MTFSRLACVPRVALLKQAAELLSKSALCVSEFSLSSQFGVWGFGGLGGWGFGEVGVSGNWALAPISCIPTFIKIPSLWDVLLHVDDGVD